MNEYIISTDLEGEPFMLEVNVDCALDTYVKTKEARLR